MLQSSDRSLIHPMKYSPSRADSGSLSARLPSTSDPAPAAAWINPLSGDALGVMRPNPSPFGAWKTNPPSPASGQANPSPVRPWTNHTHSASWDRSDQTLSPGTNPASELLSSSGGASSVTSCAAPQTLAAKRHVFASSLMVMAEGDGKHDEKGVLCRIGLTLKCVCVCVCC